MPAPIFLTPAYDNSGRGANGPAATAGIMASAGESANVNGRLALTSMFILPRAMATQSTGVNHAAVCFLEVMPNGKPPIRISANFRPARSFWIGSIADAGGGAVDLRWNFLPRGEIEINGAWSRMTQLQPTHFRQERDTNASGHGWGPKPVPPGAANLPLVHWTWNGTLPGSPQEPVPFWIQIGIESLHSVTASNVFLTSITAAEVQLRSVTVQMS